jgi:uncharacterized repeat protein (TIGR03803 family)
MLHGKFLENRIGSRLLQHVLQTLAAALAAAIAIAGALGPPAMAAPQETVLYAFQHRSVGHPDAGLLIGPSGVLFGTTAGGLPCYVYVKICGAVFMLAPTPGAIGWSETRLHRFKGGDDGATPESRLIMDPDGALYGTTMGGEGGGTGCGTVGCGTVFKLTPPAAGETLWTERVLYRFRGGADGASPSGGLIMDANGSLYGATTFGGGGGSPCRLDCGTVFKLTPPAVAKTPWTKTVLHRFEGSTDGTHASDLIMDANGALYGTTGYGGLGGFGTVFELAPPAPGTGTWTEKVLYSFKGSPDGATPGGGLIIDASGALYGTTNYGGGVCECGTVFELAPPPTGTGTWTEKVLYSFKGSPDGAVPLAGLVMDANRALYGTTSFGGLGGGGGYGTVFELTPPAAGTGTWTEAVLHTFAGAADGVFPAAGLIMDASGTLYGTTYQGGGRCGREGCGTVFQLVP